MADLFHVTRKPDAAKIARHGLLRDAMSPAEKHNAPEVKDDGWIDPVMEPADVRADRRFDELVSDAQRAAEGADQYPDHSYAVFFWDDKPQAEKTTRETNWPSVIVAVESERLGCRCAAAEQTEISSIWHTIYDSQRDRAHADMRELYEDAVEWWEADVEWYNKYGFYRERVEIWCGCDVPLRAIEYIEDPDTGKRVYEPTRAPTLFDFEEVT